jgi:hypothetical protein
MCAVGRVLGTQHASFVNRNAQKAYAIKRLYLMIDGLTSFCPAAAAAAAALGMHWMGASFLHEPGASDGWLATATSPDGKTAVVKV